jgi:hypothetical protein
MLASHRRDLGSFPSNFKSCAEQGGTEAGCPLNANYYL